MKRKSKETKILTGQPAPDEPQQTIAQFGPESELVIHIRGAKEPVIVRPGAELLAGRQDPDSDFIPDLDLTPYDAQNKGVSRRHLLIRRRADTLSLVDQDSTNGTFLNGQRLTPHKPRQLHHGDELRLGHLVMRVYFYDR